MRKERKIINTNIRLNLCDEQDRKAWEYLQTMDREKYKSYTRAVVVALNDYFSREYRNEADPYLETREKEDAFLERVETAVRDDSETKTDAGIRDIPMTQMVYDAFRKQRELNLMLGLQSNVEIGGRSGFIFNTKHGRPIMPAGVNSFLKNIVNAYNKKESKLAEEEKREPELMPPISSHTLRHTGCTRLGENNVNPKVMQYVMGHSDAQITMNVYNHIAEKSHVENEMSKMNLPETVPAVV